MSACSTTTVKDVMHRIGFLSGLSVEILDLYKMTTACGLQKSQSLISGFGRSFGSFGEVLRKKFVHTRARKAVVERFEQQNWKLKH